MAKRVKTRLNTRDTTNPGIAKRLRNLQPAGTIPPEVLEILKECGNQEDLLKKYAPAILASLVEQALHCTNPTVRASCAMYLSDKIYGKAAQPMIVSGNINHNISVMLLPIYHTQEPIIDLDSYSILNLPEKAEVVNTEHLNSKDVGKHDTSK